MEKESLITSHLFQFFEIILILSGFLMLISVFYIYQSETFTFWTLAKVFYGLGVLLFVWKA